MTRTKLLPLNLPEGASRRERQAFRAFCRFLADNPSIPQGSAHQVWLDAAGIGQLYNQPRLAAAAHTAIDLVEQGWSVEVERTGPLFAPPQADLNRETEKSRIRHQEHIRRDEQLRKPSVRRFIDTMEHVHQQGNRLVSVYNLMRDGEELAETLRLTDTLSHAIAPYVQIVDESTCSLTGFRLLDIWRYFRHTWTNAWSSVPGRSMPILIRDAATEFHAVIGIAAISSPIVQIAERDDWIGWETDKFLRDVEAEPSEKVASWFAQRITSHLSEIYVQDLLRDGVLQPTELVNPTPETIASLQADAERHRRRHHRGGSTRQSRAFGASDWVQRAETDLFRSKRSASLADGLGILTLLGGYLLSRPTVEGLMAALNDPRARAQMRQVVRRARGERVGTVVADLTVCGAIAPYNSLAAGKLVGALAVSPTVLQAYREKYSRPSEIASAMAGRPISRESRLAFIGTTSLYGTGSSQYNRLFWPRSVVGGSGTERMGFYELGRSRSYGTSHISDDTVKALVRLSSLSGDLIRVNNLFGEGVSPRLRKVRLGLTSLGWPASDLLKHGRKRIVYGVPLVQNLRDFALGIDSEPYYFSDPMMPDSDASVGEWWLERWCRGRAAQPAVIEAMRRHRLTRPVRHGARVSRPSDYSGQVDLLESLDLMVGN